MTLSQNGINLFIILKILVRFNLLQMTNLPPIISYPLLLQRTIEGISLDLPQQAINVFMSNLNFSC